MRRIELKDKEKEIKRIEDEVKKFYAKERENIEKCLNEYRYCDEMWNGEFYMLPSETVTTHLEAMNNVLNNINNVAEYHCLRKDLSEDLSLAKLTSWVDAPNVVELTFNHGDGRGSMHIRVTVSKEEIETFILEYCDKNNLEI